MKIKETNAPIKEVEEVKEFLSHTSNEEILENNKKVNEFIDHKDYSNQSIKSPNKKQIERKISIGTISGTMTAIVATIVVGVTSWLNVTLNAEYDAVLYEDGRINYKVNVRKLTDKERLYASLYENNKLVEEYDLVDEDEDGVINGEITLDKARIQELLGEKDKSNTRIKYRLDLKGDVGLGIIRDFDSYTVQIDRFYSHIDDVSMWCSCGVDGYYNFKINYEDPLDKYTNFEAYIIDDYQNISYCEFTNNYHDPQKIYVGDMQGSKGLLYISYLANGEPELMEFDNGGPTKDNYKIVNF